MRDRKSWPSSNKEVSTMYYRNGFKIALCAVLAAAVFALPGTAQAGPPNACSLEGTWIGQYLGQFDVYLMNVHGRTPISGTLDVAFFGFPPPAPATQSSGAKGVWQRRGPGTYAFTMLNYLSDASHNVVIRYRSTARVELSEDCNSADVVGFVEVFDGMGVFQYSYNSSSNLVRVTIPEENVP
jgi:hypothetical protein